MLFCEKEGFTPLFKAVNLANRYDLMIVSTKGVSVTAARQLIEETLLPDYIEEHGVDWNVVYDARGHFEEPHTNRRIGCGTIEVGNYLHALKSPEVIAAEFADASVDIIGPSGNISGVLFCEKEGFTPLFKAVNLANRYDLMIVSTKGVSVTAARRLIDDIGGDNNLPLFVLHDFDVAGFMIFGHCSAIPDVTRAHPHGGSNLCAPKRPTAGPDGCVPLLHSRNTTLP